MASGTVFPVTLIPPPANVIPDCPYGSGPTGDSRPCLADPVIVERTCSSYIGTAPDEQFINLGFQPDLVWLKRTTAGTPWRWMDSMRGETKYLETNSQEAERTYSDPTAFKFQTAGFSVGNANGTNENGVAIQSIGIEKASGFFDMQFYTGTSNPLIVAHDLGVVPELMIVKAYDNAFRSWFAYHKDSGNGLAIDFESASDPVIDNFWDNKTPDANNFYIGDNGGTNNINSQYIAYLFASVAGKCKIGSYAGNTTTQPVIQCDFKPNYIMIRVYTGVDNGGDWMWLTRCNDGADLITNGLKHNTDAGYELLVGGWVNFTDNTVEIVANVEDINIDGESYIYMVLA